MATPFSHAIVAIAMGRVVQPKQAPWWYWALGALLSVVPDLDVVGFHFGVRYGDFLGHRGFTHSIVFAVFLAGLVSLVFAKQNQISCRRLFLFIFLALSSHGLLDAMTNGGLGIAFFSPFASTRYFFSFHPIEVPPIGVKSFFSAKRQAVVRSEAKWLIVPSVLLFAIVTVIRRFRGRKGAMRYHN